MTTRNDESEGGVDVAPASLLDALLVYAEPLAADAYAVVIGNAETAVADRLLESGARSVHVIDADAARASAVSRAAPRGVTVRPLGADLDVRDGAFDLAVVPDLALVDEPQRVLSRLRRAVGRSGTVVAMGRTRTDARGDEPFGEELAPASLEYGELYELFANEFEQVTLIGVVPFRGVVFAELGTDDESPAVSVDTRLASGAAPSIFAIVARGAESGNDTQPSLDPYAIVQLPAEESALADEADEADEADGFEAAAMAAAQLRVGVLAAQLEETRDHYAVLEARAGDLLGRLERAVAERDAALTRAMELETILSAAQQALGLLEQRILEAERGMLERDDQLAALHAELDARESLEGAAVANGEVLHAHLARAENAEAALALNIADLAQVVEAHAGETAGYEEQLRERARVIAQLEREILRREALVKELVASLEESRDGASTDAVFEAAAPLAPSAPRRESAPQHTALEDENVRLRQKLDELASEIARREGELTARAWRITELENARDALGAPASPAGELDAGARSELEASLARARDEVDALRQALAQEHAARLALESDAPR